MKLLSNTLALRIVWAIAAAASGTVAVAQSAPSVPLVPPAKALGCLIEPFSVAEVGSQVIGVIQSVHVERGDYVRKGQLIAQLRSDIERAAVAVAESRMQGEAEVAAAAAASTLARQKLARSIDLANREFISAQALEQTRAEAEVADQKLEQAREQKRIWAREYDLARAQLALRQILSPVDGVITDRYKSAGERVEEKAIVRVATIDPLRVEIVLPAALFGTVRVGEEISISPEIPNAAPRKGKVVVVDRLVDGPSNTFRVRLELPNPGRVLPAGLRCKADLAQSAARDAAASSDRVAPQPAGANGKPLAPEPARRNGYGRITQ
jgi:RND family efflux transporter MFP subunit